MGNSLEGEIFMKKLAKITIVTTLVLIFVAQEMSHVTAEDRNVEQILKEKGIVLTIPKPPKASFVYAVRTGNLVFLSGHGPKKTEGGFITGKVGKDLTVAEGQQAARLTAISLLSSLQAEIGDLNKVKRVVKVFGMVNATDSFTQHSVVINGCSDLLIEVFGDNGKHARAAVGMVSLPLDFAVEIEMIVEVE